MAFFIHPDDNTSEIPNSVYVNISNERLLCNEIYVNDTKNGTRTRVFPLYYYLDINGADNGLVDVYINGSLVASGVSDYYQQHPYGSTYEIKNIRPKSGYNYDGVTGGSLSGTITGATTVTLSFSITTTYVFQNGSLGSGISVSGASISGNIIYAGVGSGADDEGNAEVDDLTVTISGIDLTNYNKLYISTTSELYNHYGEAYCNVGIDNTNTRFFTVNSGTGTGEQFTNTITLDVSSYTGVHSLKFYLYARSDSSYSGYHSVCRLGITEIKLFL